MAGDHTVVALAGPPAAGSRRLFNALVGADVADDRCPPADDVTPDGRRVGRARVRAARLAGRGPRHVGRRRSAGARDGAVRGGWSLDGLVLLDLPDFDSRELDAPASRPSACWGSSTSSCGSPTRRSMPMRGCTTSTSQPPGGHDAVTLVRAQPGRPAAAGGRRGVSRGPRPAAQGGRSRGRPGAHDLVADRRGIVDAAAAAGQCRCRHMRPRVSGCTADLVGAAGQLRPGWPRARRTLAPLPRDRLLDALARPRGGVRSCSTPSTRTTVARRSRSTGWLFARWDEGLRPDPLRRLRLDRRRRPPIPVEIDAVDVRAVVGRSSIPAPTVSTVSAVELATRCFVRDASEGLPVAGAEAVEDAVDGGDGALSDSLDRAVIGTSLRARRRSGGSSSTSSSGCSDSSPSPGSSGMPCCGSSRCCSSRAPRPRRSASCRSRSSCSSSACCSVSGSGSCPGGGRASVLGTGGPSSASG